VNLSKIEAVVRSFDESKHKRHPKGSPGSTGGEFAPSSSLEPGSEEFFDAVDREREEARRPYRERGVTVYRGLKVAMPSPFEGFSNDPERVDYMVKEMQVGMDWDLGIHWTVNPEVAERFSQPNKEFGSYGVVVEALVLPEDVIPKADYPDYGEHTVFGDVGDPAKVGGFGSEEELPVKPGSEIMVQHVTVKTIEGERYDRYADEPAEMLITVDDKSITDSPSFKKKRKGKRSWDESKHPRDPGGEDGGEWVAKDATAVDEGEAEADESSSSPAEAEGETLDEMLVSMGAMELEGGEERHPERYMKHPKSGFTVPKPGVVYPEAVPPVLDEDGWGRKPPRIRDVMHSEAFKTPEGFSDEQALGYGKWKVGDDRPPDYVYRAISEEEWEGIQKNGFIQTDGRMNLSSDEGTVTALSNPSYYLPGALASDKPGTYHGRIIRIRYRDEDGWRHDRDDYVKTSKPVPIEQVDMVTPKLEREVKPRPGKDWNDIGPWEKARAWDESKHPRDPGGEDGGQWIKKGTSAAGATIGGTDGKQGSEAGVRGPGSGRPDVRFTETTPGEFLVALHGNTRAWNLSEHTADELADARVFLSPDRKTGIAVTADGDIQNAFRNPGGVKGSGSAAVAHAIREGGITLDCYDGFLPDLYSTHGMVETGRMKFNPEYAPEGMPPGETPDVVFMAYRAKPRARRYFDDWDEAKEYSRKAALKAPKTGPDVEDVATIQDWMNPELDTKFKPHAKAAKAAVKKAAKKRAFAELELELLARAGYNPAQARDPGGEGGGQWVKAGAALELDPAAEYLVPVEELERVDAIRSRPGQGDRYTRTTKPVEGQEDGSRDALLIQVEEALGPGHTIEEYNRWTTVRLRQLVDPMLGATVATRVPWGAVPLILERGELVPAFDEAHFPNDRTAKAAYMSGRSEIEMRLFGSHPLYGYVATDSEDLDGSIAKAFGDVKVTLLDDVRYRTTITYSDSMFIGAGTDNSDAIPRPIDSPDHRAVASWMNLGGVEVPVHYKGQEPRPLPPESALPMAVQEKLANMRRWGRSPEDIQHEYESAAFDVPGYNRWRHGDFIEAQIHGPITLDDVKRFDFPTMPDEATIRLLEKRRIPWTVGGPTPPPAPPPSPGAGKFVRVTHSSGEVEYAEGLASVVMKDYRAKGVDTSTLKFAPIDRTPAEDIRIREGGAGKVGDTVKIKRHGLTYTAKVESVGPKNAKVTYTANNGKTKTISVAHRDYKLA
jgi:hypothetical protein